MEALVAQMYPPLSERSPMPAYYFPACFALAITPFLLLQKWLGITLTVLPLLMLVIRVPNYTFGDSSSDYYNSGPFMALMLWYVDFVLVTPRHGDGAPTFKGSPGSDTDKPQSWADLTTTWQKIKWASRLMLPAHRGIGWNWEVKGIAPDTYAELPKWRFACLHILWAEFYYVQSTFMLVVLGWSSEVQRSMTATSGVPRVVVNSIVGWSGAIWVWDRLNCAYSAAAALTVCLGLFDVWEWPPLMAPLKSAWSVRQMWSNVYHQVFRRMLSQPSIWLVHMLGLRKGTLPSQYTQLYVSFGISCIFHQFQMFNVTRRDMGEFAFFMSQPVAITMEDIVQWLWRRIRGPNSDSRFAKVVGYLWTIAWFSFSLHLYVDGLLEAGVIVDWILGRRPLKYGASLNHSARCVIGVW